MLTFLGASLLAPVATAQTVASYHWARKQPHFTLRVGNNVAGDWNAYLREALSEWNQNGTVTLEVVEGATDPQNCQPVPGTVEVCDWWYGTQTGWLGMTRLFFNASGDHIDAATVQLNNSFLYAPNSPYNNDAARRHTICHELGHTIGLDHPDTTSCMNNSQYAVFTYVSPIGEDFRWLRGIYEHQDASRTVARESEGDLSFFDATGLPSVPSGLTATETVMVLPLDDGTSVHTFITWVDDAVLADTVVATETVQDVDSSAGALEGVIDLDPTNADTDADRVADRDELSLYHTNPTVADTDGDGVFDGEELFGSYTDPLLWDDFTAVSSETAAETGAQAPGAIATVTDLDADNYPDALELEHGLDLNNPDTDGDGVADGDESSLYGTDPGLWDSDGDGLSDGVELFDSGVDPIAAGTGSDSGPAEEIDVP